MLKITVYTLDCDSTILIPIVSPFFSGILAFKFLDQLKSLQNEDTFKIAFIELIFQSDTVLYLYVFRFYSICGMSICKQEVYIMWRKWVKLKQINIYVFFKSIHPSLNIGQGRIAWISFSWTVSMSPWVILNWRLQIALVEWTSMFVWS